MVLKKAKSKISKLAKDRHKMNKVKYARESLQLEREAKAYWDSLSETEKKKIAGQLYMENKADMVALANKTEEEINSIKIRQKRELLKLNAAEFRQQLWMMVAKVAVITLIVVLLIVIADAMISYLIHSFSGGN